MSAIATTIPSFVASEQRLALLRKRRAGRCMQRSLFDGKWYKALVEGGRTQHYFRKVDASTNTDATEARQLIVGVGLVKKAIKTHADLVTARPVLLATDDGFEEQEAFLNDLRERTLFDATYHEAVLRCFAESEAALRVDVAGDQVIVRLCDNDDTFPVGEPGPDGQPTVWERRWIIEKPNPSNPRKTILFLRIERHRVLSGPTFAGLPAGVVEQEAYLTESSDLLQSTAGLERVSLDRVLGPGHGLADLTPTGLDAPTIVQLVAYRMDGEPQGTIDEADLGLIDAMVAGMSRLGRTLEQHGQAKMRVPEAMLKDGKLVEPFELFMDPDRLVEYIQAHFEFDAMAEFFNQVMQWLIVSLDMAASLLGYKPQGGAAPESFEKLRLESVLTLANARRVASIHAPALGRLFTLASLLEARRSIRTGWGVDRVRATVRADLPKDTMTIAREQAELLASPMPLTSHRRALAEIHGDEHVDEVMAEIAADQKGATARQQAALMGASFGDPPASEPVGSGAGAGNDGGTPPQTGDAQ